MVALTFFQGHIVIVWELLFLDDSASIIEDLFLKVTVSVDMNHFNFIC